MAAAAAVVAVVGATSPVPPSCPCSAPFHVRGAAAAVAAVMALPAVRIRPAPFLHPHRGAVAATADMTPSPTSPPAKSLPPDLAPLGVLVAPGRP